MVEFMDNALSAFSDYTDKFTLNKQIDFNQPLWAAIDFSSVGTDKTIITFQNENNDTWQYEITGTLDTKYNKLSEIINKCNKLVICYCESNGVGEPMINSLKKLVRNKSKLIEFTTTNETKQNQVSLLQALLDKDIVHFEEKNNVLKNQFDTFAYAISKTKKITYSALPSFHDDNVLSLMICTQAREDYQWSNGNNIVFIKGGNSRMSMR